MLGTNPTSEDCSKYNIKILAELYRMLCTTAAAAGPFAGVLLSLTKEIRAFLYSSDKSFDQSQQVRVLHACSGAALRAVPATARCCGCTR